MAYTTIDKPTDYFNTKLYVGNASTQSITGVGFQPDWVWLKDRTNANSGRINDSVRGATKYFIPSTNGAEATESAGLTSFDSDGFSLGSNSDFNGSSANFVSWNWKAGTSFSNDASSTGVGTIDSTGSVNTTAGFSIISYTGTGSAGSVAHGLGVKPDWILSKDISASGDWNVYHDSFANQERAKLNTTAAKTTNTSIYASLPTSSVINVGTGGNINTSGNSHIFYCFAEKQGYSKFGSYTGNGNVDGPFIYTGFKPAWVMIKRTDGASDWSMMDNKRPNEFNVVQNYLKAQASDAEQTDDSFNIDILSNGWKTRYNNGNYNASGGSYIYMVFAESPFVTSTGIPTTAR